MLGAELIADEVTAVLELVKNAYDADAGLVSVRISPSDGRVTIRDDGSGMTKADILGKWMVPGTATKAATDEQGVKPRTSRGRVPLGEKGIGRFAVHHLGHKLTLVSKKLQSTLETKLQVDWTEYEDPGKYLDEIQNTLLQRAPKSVLKKGTVLIITELRSDWPPETRTRLQRALGLMMTAHAQQNAHFRVKLYFDGEEANLHQSVTDLLHSADYALSGEVTADGYFTGKFNGKIIKQSLVSRNAGEALTHETLLSAPCGPFSVALHVVDRLNRKSDLYKELNPPRGTPPCQGVLVYRDEFRVLPYGSFGVDWLGLDFRRVKKLRNIGNSQLLGFVHITHASNPKLKDKTNREGMIENSAFGSFRELLLALVNLVQSRVEEVKHSRESKPVNTLNQRLDEVLAMHTLPVTAAAKLSGVKQAYVREVKLRDERERTLIELAGVGLAAERLTHEVGFLMRGIKAALQTLQKETNTPAAVQLRQYIIQLERDLQYLEPLYKAARRRKELVSVQEVVEYAFFLFQHDFSTKAIDVALTKDSEDFSLTMNRGLLMQVLVNLIDNAVFWLQKEAASGRKIRIRIAPQSRSIVVADSGPGIEPADQPMIFEPFFSARGGRGLGLYIARDALAEAGHTIELVTDRTMSILKGAAFNITMTQSED